MTVSAHGTCGGASSPQSKRLSTTTALGTYAALLRRSLTSGSPRRCSSTTWPNTSGRQVTWPSIARAQGSSSSLSTLYRRPSAGSHGPNARTPYLCPARSSGSVADLEEADLDLVRVSGEDGEVHAIGRHCCAVRGREIAVGAHGNQRRQSLCWAHDRSDFAAELPAPAQRAPSSRTRA